MLARIKNAEAKMRDLKLGISGEGAFPKYVPSILNEYGRKGFSATCSAPCLISGVGGLDSVCLADG